jgi:molecular chaperone HscB
MVSSRIVREPAPVSSSAKCPKCGAAMDVPYACPACGELQREPPRLDHFTRFGIGRAYELDLQDLDRRFLALSRRVHPDRMVGKTPAERNRALLLTAALNEANTVLRDPVRRAEYLLALAGGASADKDRRTPQGFLEDALELREAAEEAREAKDRPRLERLRDEVTPRREAALGRIGAVFRRAGAALDKDGGLGCAPREALRLELNALKYLTNFLDELRGSLR